MGTRRATHRRGCPRKQESTNEKKTSSGKSGARRELTETMKTKQPIKSTEPRRAALFGLLFRLKCGDPTPLMELLALPPACSPAIPPRD